jgi:rsbT co-antagonist protein RsbR
VTLEERIERLLLTLGKATSADFEGTVAITETPDDFQAVEAAASVLVHDLLETKRRNREHLHEIELKNREIAERQSMALRELSTPIISVWDEVLTLPVIGAVDTVRSAEMMDTLLERVVQEQSQYVIIDITGSASSTHALRTTSFAWPRRSGSWVLSVF